MDIIMKPVRSVFWDSLSYFDPSEFDAPEEMSTRLLASLDLARHAAGVPFRITSSFRRGDPGAHGSGEAVDISCRTSQDRMKMVSALLEVGFRRIGVYRMHIHVDIADDRPQDVLWYGRYHSETREVSDEAEKDE